MGVAAHRLTLYAGYLRDGGLDHGYALTVHQAQGLTCQRAMLLGSDALYREAGYVGLSRGRQRNDLHLVERAAADNPEQELCRAPGGPTTTSTLRSPPSATPWVEVGHSPSRTMSAAEALGTSLAASRPRWDSDKGTQVTAAYR
ncbi:MAG: hypothetical protein ACR2FG_07460 [Marmoricola sp.]